MIIDANDFSDDVLIHYGIIRRSGRYPWGSHGNVAERSKSFLDYYNEMRKKGVPDSVIAKAVSEMNPDSPMSVLDLRAAKSIAVNERKASNVAMAQRLKDKGYRTTAIAERMGVPEPTVRSWLKPGAKDKANVLTNTANMLRRQVDEKGMIDVGAGTELDPKFGVGVSRTRMDTALSMLKQEGYGVHNVPINVGGGNKIQRKVLCQPGITQYEAFLNRDKIQLITEFSSDNGRTYGHLHEPLQIDPSRVAVVHKEQGGGNADGMIYIRPGVKDVEIGANNYAQVRVAVGPDHYLKGMAMYKDDLPEGKDIEFHTSKSSTGNDLDAMKKNSSEPGYAETGAHPLMKSVTRQIVADAGTKTEHVTSAMNMVNEEGDWSKWSKNFSSQMLSKQKPALAKEQLAKRYDRNKQEYEEISSLTNPTVKKKLLLEFADAADYDAVHLQAASFPRTSVHVILPSPKIAKDQIYAPNYENGEKVALIRHPHAGTFEIPVLTVNNNHRDSKRIIGPQVKDAVGIHPSVAAWLSGADFDGDTVLVIPDKHGKISTSKAIKELQEFDPRSAYPEYEGMKRMKNTQTEMGMISNLITDMSLKEATIEELTRAVKHSMVVIDAEKHGLNYQQSARDNGIQQLKQKYQTGGASTLISRARAKTYVPQVQERRMARGGPIDPVTGQKMYEPTNKINKNTGKPRQSHFPRLALTDDAHTLMSTSVGTPMERLYAEHSNKLKSLAQRSRVEALKIPNPKVSSSAKKAYKPEVDSLLVKLNLAKKNAPLERQARAIADYRSRARISANPNMTEDAKKKVRYQALVQARNQTGADKHKIEISDAEWDAIQAGAISKDRLEKILANADMSIVRQHATPQRAHLMTSTKIDRAKAMFARGATRAEVANALGVSLTTLDVAMKGEG